MTTLADELKDIASNNAIRLREERELVYLNKEKEKQVRIDLVLQKTYDYFESNWLKKAKEAAFKGHKSFSVELKENGRKQNDDYDKTSDCYYVTGVYLCDLYQKINNLFAMGFISIIFYYICVKISTIFYSSFLCFIVHIYNTKSLRITLCPLKIIH